MQWTAPTDPSRPKWAAGSGDAVQGKGAGGLLPVCVSGAERVQRGASCGPGGVHEMDRSPRAAVGARKHLCRERVLGRLSQPRAAGLIVANSSSARADV
eukprot:1767361-Prymnesium_polylepis.1